MPRTDNGSIVFGGQIVQIGGDNYVAEDIDFGDDHREIRTRGKPTCTLSSGTEIEANVREIEHPHGRLERIDGTRFDICIMDVQSDPSIEPPMLRCFPGEMMGERSDTRDERLTIGKRAPPVIGGAQRIQIAAAHRIRRGGPLYINMQARACVYERSPARRYYADQEVLIDGGAYYCFGIVEAGGKVQFKMISRIRTRLPKLPSIVRFEGTIIGRKAFIVTHFDCRRRNSELNEFEVEAVEQLN